MFPAGMVGAEELLDGFLVFLALLTLFFAAVSTFLLDFLVSDTVFFAPCLMECDGLAVLPQPVAVSTVTAANTPHNWPHFTRLTSL